MIDQIINQSKVIVPTTSSRESFALLRETFSDSSVYYHFQVYKIVDNKEFIKKEIVVKEFSQIINSARELLNQ